MASFFSIMFSKIKYVYASCLSILKRNIETSYFSIKIVIFVILKLNYKWYMVLFILKVLLGWTKNQPFPWLDVIWDINFLNLRNRLQSLVFQLYDWSKQKKIFREAFEILEINISKIGTGVYFHSHFLFKKIRLLFVVICARNEIGIEK